MDIHITDRLKALLGRKFILSVLAILLVTFAIDVPPEVKLEAVKWLVMFAVGVQAGQNVAGILKD